MRTVIAVLTSRCCSFRLDPQGFVRATMNEGADFERADATEAVSVTWKVAGEKRRSVLVDMRGVRSQTRDAREYFMSDEVAGRISAVALLVGSPLSRMIGNFFLRIGDHRIPTRIFTADAAATAWLLEQPA